MTRRFKSLEDIQAASAVRATQKENAEGIKVTKFGAFKAAPEVDEAKAKAMEIGEIFKFQAPLISTSKQPMCLVYNEKRTWVGELPMDENLSKLFMEKGSNKFYLMAIPRADGQLIMQNFVEDQNW